MQIRDPSRRWYFYLTILATLLAFCVILLGAYIRLKDAGLGCPDWPGCYGQMIVPHTKSDVIHANSLYPHSLIEPSKAWSEMVHRYFAGTLGLIIFFLAIWATLRKFQDQSQPVLIPLILAVLVIFQAALGMWTVTWELYPLVVMSHLLGGMTILGLLWFLFLKTGKFFENHSFSEYKNLKSWVILGVIIVAIQIFLGGWTSANYASLACTSFPTCNGGYFPLTDFQQGFNFLSPIGVDYQGGNLNMPARVAIHLAHRFWGFITGFYILVLSLYLIASRRLKLIGWILVVLILLQISLGILNVLLRLPLVIALAHNGVAALVLLSLITLIYLLYSLPIREHK